MKLIITFIILLSIKGCSTKVLAPENPNLGKVFSINHSETLEVQEELIVTYFSYEESRCPEGVQCIRAGELFATLQLKDKKSDTQVAATFCVAGECLAKKSFPQRVIYYSGDEVKVGDTVYTVDIQDFSPQKSTQSPTDSAYNLSLLIKK